MATQYIDEGGIMGRIPTKYLNLPSHMRARPQKSGKTYYYFDQGGKPRKEIPLGADYALAIKRWSELEQALAPKHCAVVTFRYAAERYLESRFFLKLSDRTKLDYRGYLENVYKFFDDPPAPLDSIESYHIQRYIDWRSKSAPVRANRERAIISVVWNCARSLGYTKLANPCQGVKGNTEDGRDIYIEDDVLKAVWNAACQPIRDSMDLAYLIGQRPSDVLKSQQTDIKSGFMLVKQGKTDARLRIAIEGELKIVLDRISARKSGLKVSSLALICDEHGKKLSYGALRSRFDQARVTAAKDNPDLAVAIKAFQFRDLRAKAGTDKSDSEDMQAAQKQLGHRMITTTQKYIRKRLGEKVTPTK